ncbi:hypothetical protein MGYG_05479 [Nannizzia gypsea CBS 118893]|uniref:Uncharacterized protein n=1 Tax=Arthroderma gypseum (strain ATCC MYA-4604 / CBS 118893) TaxID=535722 RepID=E4UW38_ARTGP|nr:hypothetical protein MGYG_05479 [Nannizzia gypsea CBS 118893]EFR02486.1 hypothetical protein MGYG_05479 [Nannizzia gypsea CBS 118893]
MATTLLGKEEEREEDNYRLSRWRCASPTKQYFSVHAQQSDHSTLGEPNNQTTRQRYRESRKAGLIAAAATKPRGPGGRHERGSIPRAPAGTASSPTRPTLTCEWQMEGTKSKGKLVDRSNSLSLLKRRASHAFSGGP